MYWVKNQSANISVKMNKCQIQQKWNKDENHQACQKHQSQNQIERPLDLNRLTIGYVYKGREAVCKGQGAALGICRPETWPNFCTNGFFSQTESCFLWPFPY